MKLTKSAQKVAADILIDFAFVNNMEEFREVWGRVYERYELCDDPFTHLPCTPDEYCESSLEYDRQTMYERYGHCDGLE